MRKLKTSTSDVLSAYLEIESTRSKYGKLKKAEIHFHTPASYDYNLIEGKRYQQLTEYEMLDYCVEISMFNNDEKNIIQNKFKNGEFSGESYKDILKDRSAPYDSFKEFLAYSMIAFKLYKEDINIAIITDHNTIKGYYKLKYALEDYFSKNVKGKKEGKIPVYLFLGVEISCSDQTHVVGIFNEENYENVEKFLEDNIYTEETGTIETSFSIINQINLLNGISYIAHVNTYEGIGSGLYKKNLFSTNLKILGLTNLSSKSWKNKTHPDFKDDKVCYLFESDAHSINKLGIQNTWIKMNEISFNSLIKSINNHLFCVYTVKPTTTDTYIKGIILNPGSTGFLKGTGKESFIVDFSKDLNCIIGGRGTGKSTILNILDTVFTNEAKDLDTLKFISLYSSIFILFSYNNEEFIIRFIPQANQALPTSHPDFFLEAAFDKKGQPPKGNNIKLNKNWYDLFKVDKNKNITLLGSEYETENILHRVYKKHYSINNIVNMIQNRKTGDFIKSVVQAGETKGFFDEKINNLYNTSNRDFNKTLKSSLVAIREELERFKINANDKIDSFNNMHNKLISIKYEARADNYYRYLDDLFKGINTSTPILNTMFTIGDFIDYTHRVLYHIDFFTLLSLLFNRKFNDLNSIEPIKKFTSNELTIKSIGSGYQNINSISEKDLYSEILKILRMYKHNIIRSIATYVESMDNYTLQFNVNSKASIENLPIHFNNIEHLSLGQQVVAILTLIIEYGKYCGDNTPFIIDQPEDNLDNQYIYNNLVASLRNIKNYRQVIIVTHNSSIVTNADSEQVIVLESNGLNGLIRKKGYLSDKSVMKLILVHLEGGENAFENKVQSYSAILDKI